MWTGSLYPCIRDGGNPSVHNGPTGNLSAELAGVGPRRHSGEPFVTARLRGGREVDGGPHHDDMGRGPVGWR
jgi:hypothetical protein